MGLGDPKLGPDTYSSSIYILNYLCCPQENYCSPVDCTGVFNLHVTLKSTFCTLHSISFMYSFIFIQDCTTLIKLTLQKAFK